MTELNNQQQPDIEGAIGLLTSPDPQLRQFVAYLLRASTRFYVPSNP